MNAPQYYVVRQLLVLSLTKLPVLMMVSQHVVFVQLAIPKNLNKHLPNATQK